MVPYPPPIAIANQPPRRLHRWPGATIAHRIPREIARGVIISAAILAATGVGTRAAFAQIPLSIGDLPQQLYQQLPDFPRENQYRDRETGETAPGNTLLRRFVRYHLYVKARSPFSRLDWKLTLADYLGANQYLDAEDYPDSNRLTPTAIDGDLAAIRALDRRGRDRLVETLVTAFEQRFGSNDRPQPPNLDRQTEVDPGQDPTPRRRNGADALRMN